jgi:tetratricopeptide (TPR) repeat protein
MFRRHQKSGIYLVLYATLLLLPAAVFAKSDKVPEDRAEAEKWIHDATHRFYKIDRLDDQYLLYSSSGNTVHYGIALARISGIHFVYDREYGYKVVWRDYTRDQDESIVLYLKGRTEKFTTALEYLANAARESREAQEDSMFRNFLVQAKAWREANPKPAMPEQAHEHQVLAEYAFQHKDTDKAINEYKAAVAIFPTWPEGQFNLATLAGEAKEFDTAVFHMREYLELAPNSPDAENAKDSIIVWKDRLNTAVTVAQENAKNEPERRHGFLHK